MLCAVASPAAGGMDARSGSDTAVVGAPAGGRRVVLAPRARPSESEGSSFGIGQGWSLVRRVMSSSGVRVVSRSSTYPRPVRRPLCAAPGDGSCRSADGGRRRGLVKRAWHRMFGGATGGTQRDTVESSHGRGPRTWDFEGEGRPALPYRFVTRFSSARDWDFREPLCFATGPYNSTLDPSRRSALNSRRFLSPSVDAHPARQTSPKLTYYASQSRHFK